VYGHAGELVRALDRELAGQVFLGVGQDVDRERLPFSTAAPVSLVLFRQTNSMGGSIDRDDMALAVVPKGCPSTDVVMTVTPLANRPTTSRNAF
jgi:hypothetical protein